MKKDNLQLDYMHDADNAFGVPNFYMGESFARLRRWVGVFCRKWGVKSSQVKFTIVTDLCCYEHFTILWTPISNLHAPPPEDSRFVEGGVWSLLTDPCPPRAGFLHNGKQVENQNPE